VDTIKDILRLNPQERNVIVGDYTFTFNNHNPVIRINFNFEHTLVVPGGRDAHNCISGVIPVLGGEEQTYLVRIDNHAQFIQSDMVVDYSFPNCINIRSCGFYNDYVKKLICVSPLLYPIYHEKENRTIECLTTFINTEEPRRKQLLQNIPSTFNHLNINNCFDKNSIIELYRHTKILINIHQTDHHHTCEELRVLPALMSGVIVISEESPLKEHIPYYKHIIWTKYENIIECVQNVQSNYDFYFSQIFQQGEVLTDILTNSEKNNKSILQEHLFAMNTEFYHVCFGQFNDTSLRTLHNAGFFSCCSVLLHLIVHYINTYKRLPMFVDTTPTLDWYKPDEENQRDIFPDYFVCNTDLQIEYTRDIDYTEHDQFKEFNKVDFEPLFLIVRKFFNPSDEIQRIIRELEVKYDIDYENTCVLFLRGNDKATECTIPETTFYREAANRLLGENPSLRFMIQSDETEFLETMSAEYPVSFYCKDEIRHIAKSSTTVDIVFKHMNYEFSKKFLAIMFIMSKCKHVVCNYGNCSIWIALFRGHIENVIEYVAQKP
jgi:hypothetical protein